MKRKIVAALAVVSPLIPTAAFALPFSATPEGFAAYLSALDWDDGKTRKFSGLRGCRKGILFGNTGFYYNCEYGYVRIDDPVRGSIFCEIQKIDRYYKDYAVTWDSINKIVNQGSPYPCRKL